MLQVLTERRAQSQDIDCDPLVWTTQRLLKWARSIDLKVGFYWGVKIDEGWGLFTPKFDMVAPSIYVLQTRQKKVLLKVYQLMTLK